MKILDPDKQYSLPKPESEIDKLLNQIHDASANWYKTHDPKYIKEFHDIYYKLRALDWDGVLDIEVELPDSLMPQAYIDRVNEAVILAEKAKEHGLVEAMRILFVTNNIEMQTIIRSMLELLGYEVLANNNDQSGVEQSSPNLLAIHLAHATKFQQHPEVAKTIVLTPQLEESFLHNIKEVFDKVIYEP